MNRLIRPIILLLGAFFLSGGWVLGDAGTDGLAPTLTHADAAVILAKYSGFFDRYVEEDAELNECVAFLNKAGIYFGLMEVVNGSEFSVKDAAKAFGQIELVLNGEAEFSGGKVKLPKGIDSWEEYCTLNRVRYVEAHQTMIEMLRIAYE
ncbi:MAG: hypothetical protein KAU94_06795 [Verrucomicrobia bacterium]|nr:hypothetical protein [Verrucomicrobiota bacterium]